MQAIIMAGGQGTRLRPLTCDRPKPLVPVCGRPVIGYVLALLGRHGIDRAVVTLGHRARQVEAFLAAGQGTGATWLPEEGPAEVVTLVEQRPLGTAGSVAAAWRSGLVPDGSLLVLSGDGLTDLDLGALIAFHRQRGAQLTLALTRVKDPQEYGIVLTRPDGLVERFLEKPGWGEAFADTANTGIYVLETEVLAGVPPERPWDFSRDLFPRLLAAGARVYGWLGEGYWCDIGEPDAYRRANLDVLRGRTAFSPPGILVAPGVRLGEGAFLDTGADVRGPVLLGPGARVEEGAVLEGGVVIGARARVGTGARLYGCVLGEDASVAPGAVVEEALVAARAFVGTGGRVFPGGVVGPGARVGPEAAVHPGVLVWAGRSVDRGSQVRRHVIWQDRACERGPGLLAARFPGELDPVRAVRLGEALAEALAPGPVVVGAADDRAASLVAHAVAAGLAFAGRRVLALPPSDPVLVAWAVRRAGAPGGVHVPAPDAGGYVALALVGRGGLPLSRDEERHLQRAAQSPGPGPGGTSDIPPPPRPGVIRLFPEAWELFCQEACSVRGSAAGGGAALAVRAGHDAWHGAGAASSG